MHMRNTINKPNRINKKFVSLKQSSKLLAREKPPAICDLANKLNF